jgi:hypothetical protein
VRDAKPIDLTNGGHYTSKQDSCQNVIDLLFILFHAILHIGETRQVLSQVRLEKATRLYALAEYDALRLVLSEAEGSKGPG